VSQPAVTFDGVWKMFRRGERHDSLRDLVPALAKRMFRRRVESELADEEFWAVRDVSFQVGAGEAFGIIGPNGAGKSTILKLLTKILKPTRGQCAVRGRVSALIEVAAGFHADLTGRENVYLQGAVMGMKRREITRRLDEIVDFAEVHDFIDTPVKRYSSGMNARLGFSIAAHLDPDVLIIDEVLSVGDQAFQQKCQTRMEEYRDRGVAIVFVSHHLPSVLHLCRNALLLDHGRPAAIGPSTEVVAHYCAQAVAHGDSAAASLVAHVRTANEHGAFNRVLTLEPGASITLDVEVQFRAPVTGVIVGLVVWEAARNLPVYASSSDRFGIGPFTAKAGDRMSLQFSFVANLVRGLYSVEVDVYDLKRQTQLAVTQRKPFSITEGISQFGIANLYLECRDVGGGLTRSGMDIARVAVAPEV
jgi:lipopolysaccharide transport system ATP-binding protein